MKATDSRPTVFISYSHKDKAWKERLLTQLRVLEMEEILDPWVDTRIETGDDWYPEIENALERCSVAILLITADFLTSNFIRLVEVPELLSRRQSEGLRIYPIICKPCPWRRIEWLSRMQVRPENGGSLSGKRKHLQETEFARVAEEIADIVGHGSAGSDAAGAFVLPPERISVKLPVTGPNLFGREVELETLDTAWADPQTNIVSIVAWGGVGKSALVNYWLNRMSKRNYCGARRVYGWSFYSQGTKEDQQASADFFIYAALRWFGYEPREGESAWEKGRRLAELVRAEKTLLILDGLEPLQSPPGEHGGALRDEALRCLVGDLAMNNPGLCVITTRFRVEDLENCSEPQCVAINLDHLSDEAGAHLLESLGVGGTQEEREEAARDFGGHALALTLLGNYLKTVYDGDIRKRDKIGRLMDDQEQGGHAKRVMESYENWFITNSKPELSILRVMGLFDRPASADAVAALRDPAIGGLTSALKGLSEAEWRYALRNLRKAGLLDPQSSADPDSLDCHPLIREYFGDKLKRSRRRAWKEGHSRLFDYYTSLPKKNLPDTLEEMAPLFAAIPHGCAAGRYEEALHVFKRRIHRGAVVYAVHYLGAIGANLAAVSAFFDEPWTKITDALSASDKGLLLNAVGFCLEGLGRPAEAVQPMAVGLSIELTDQDWKNAAAVTTNLSDIYLALGEITKALDHARRSVDLADKCVDFDQSFLIRSAVANALHQVGQITEAVRLFAEIEDTQKARQPNYPFLYSYQGFRYCDLLLSQGDYDNAARRAAYALEVSSRQEWICDMALDNLSLGRSSILKIRTEGTGNYDEAVDHLDRAVDGLRKSGQQLFVPLGLLARAELSRQQGNFDNARRDLEEAERICVRGGMRLYEADCHLEWVRFHLDQGQTDQARERLEKAHTMIEQMGYHRRDAEVQDLEAKLSATGD